MNKREQEKLQRERQEDLVLNKVLWWIVGAVILEFLILLLNRYYVHYTPAGIPLAQTLRTVFGVLQIVLPVCAIALAAWYVSLRKGGKPTRLAGVLTLVGIVLAVCAVLVSRFGGSGIRLLYTGIPAVTVLALIYYLYQREFFVCAVLSAMGLLGVYVIPRAGISAVAAYGYAAVCAAAVAAVLVLARKLPTGQGVLEAGGKKLEVFPKNANYTMLYVTCAVVAAVLIATAVLGELALLYGVVVAWLLVMAVYYTVRLM